MTKHLNVSVGGVSVRPEAGAMIMDVIPAGARESGALGAVCANSLAELTDSIYEDCKIDLLDIGHRPGHMIYQRSAALLLVYAVKTVLGPGADVVIKHSVNKNLSWEVYGADPGDGGGELAGRLEEVMRKAAEDDMPIDRITMTLRQAAPILAAAGDHDALNMLKFRRSSTVTLYKLGGHWVCLQGPVVPSAGYVKDFKLIPDKTGFILRIPNPSSSRQHIDIFSLRKIREVYQESSAWAKIMGVDNVGALNTAICDMHGGDIIRVNEALHQKRLAEIAEEIYRGGKTVALIAGPSSSGKTTFSKRLCVHLRALGMEPSLISLDNYFHNKVNAPLDDFGKPDLESFDFLDRDQLKKDLARLLDGEIVKMPTYNFLTGEREYRGDTMNLGPRGILVLEGIHGLNHQLTDNVPKENKYRIFISVMTQINLDRHNRIPTSDTRLIRRIVRDMRYRGRAAVGTLEMWESVSRGEEKNIFPFQEDVDVVFNSALVYEMCVLKQYAESLLFAIGENSPCRPDARRLLGHLDSFVPLPHDDVPNDSLLREFIGGGCFSH